MRLFAVLAEAACSLSLSLRGGDRDHEPLPWTASHLPGLRRASGAGVSEIRVRLEFTGGVPWASRGRTGSFFLSASCVLENSPHSYDPGAQTLCPLGALLERMAVDGRSGKRVETHRKGPGTTVRWALETWGPGLLTATRHLGGVHHTLWLVGLPLAEASKEHRIEPAEGNGRRREQELAEGAKAWQWGASPGPCGRRN